MLTQLFLLLITLATSVLCEPNATVIFPTIQPDTDIGTCTCDLTAFKCDPLCCCDSDCSPGDQAVFNCSSEANQFTTSTPPLSTIQPTCFKNISIFRSNTPYVIWKMGELICVDYDRYPSSQYYQQPLSGSLNTSNFVRSINVQNAVTLPVSASSIGTAYYVGTPVLTRTNATNLAFNFLSLPVTLFNSQTCSGLQSITYMNDFTSTCIQPVNSATCLGALNTAQYINGGFCLVHLPSNTLNSSTPTSCASATGATTGSFNVATGTCPSALQTLTIIIQYSNPNGINNVSLSLTTADATATTSFQQTFTVHFVKNLAVTTSTSRSGNPGYLQGANILAGTANGTIVQYTSLFSLLQATASGSCNGTQRIPIRFGENVRSTCQTSSTCLLISDIQSIFMPIYNSTLYIAAYGNPDTSNFSDWLTVQACSSQIGYPNTGSCLPGFLPDMTSNFPCYTRLDIQIAYANIGAVTNPQPVLGAVIFNYQGLTTTQAASSTVPVLLTQTVTFQDISSPPVTESGIIPQPNVRLPGDFFYPFSLNRGSSFPFLSSEHFLLLIVVLVLM